MRTRLWQVRETSLNAKRQVVLRLGLQDNADTRALWDFAFDLELTVTVGTTLTMALTSRNTGDQPFTLTDALHSYFCVADIDHTLVRGLEGCDYLDKLQNFARARQSGAITFTGETDRIYVDTTADCVIDDPGSSAPFASAKPAAAPPWSGTPGWNVHKPLPTWPQANTGTWCVWKPAMPGRTRSLWSQASRMC